MWTEFGIKKLVDFVTQITIAILLNYCWHPIVTWYCTYIFTQSLFTHHHLYYWQPIFHSMHILWKTDHLTNHNATIASGITYIVDLNNGAYTYWCHFRAYLLAFINILQIETKILRGIIIVTKSMILSVIIIRECGLWHLQRVHVST